MCWIGLVARFFDKAEESVEGSVCWRGLRAGCVGKG